MDDTEEDHALTSDDDADDYTIERIAQGFPLASVLRRERDTHGAITQELALIAEIVGLSAMEVAFTSWLSARTGPRTGSRLSM